ncbi:HlyD family type I secretion periplasmic adaptor subunit [Legionella spiritensis]|uniref:Membrane fusion protein (MFP) family protein n=1 Tax=Legionella spiritensis TaxID=452 RepID=A0A0W0Z4K4_LEGSP|nr:HlyD family type I secretion periplasmic adaptor subunit [Legionella spiritensis]KTD64080.1 secretion system protein D [Legionella spiritensis]SNV37642.1 HlyD family secretion protein [Legionella spiritensis]VEG90115.1 HlyD family secretion protein [Legionella spiritensis]
MDNGNPHKLPETSESPIITSILIFGFIILIVFVGGFLLWSMLFRLDAAAVAPGKLMVQNVRKTVQHMEGGIIKKIYIDEGSAVKANTPLIKLDDTQAKASVDLLQGQVYENLASESRIFAELNNEKTIDYPEELLQKATNPKVKKIISGQNKLFTANTRSYEGQIKVLNERIEEFHHEIKSLEAQVDSGTEQLSLINEEIKAVEYLEARKLIDKPRLLALRREAARLTGNRGEHLGLVAKAHQAISETKSQIYTLMESRRRDLLQNLREIQQKLADLQEKLKAAQDVLQRTLIAAPLTGTVIGLKKHTVGGVITPGQDILDIIPSEDQLIVEAEVDPLDIDIVRPGLTAKVRLSAYKQRTTPFIEGKVKLVSADVFEDQVTKKQYYKVHILLDKKDLQQLKHIHLYPGMPVQVMIIVEKRTAFDYFITPIQDSFERAFHEQ